MPAWSSRWLFAFSLVDSLGTRRWWDGEGVFSALLTRLFSHVIPESTELGLGSVFSGGRGQQSRVPALVSLSWLFSLVDSLVNGA